LPSTRVFEDAFETSTEREDFACAYARLDEVHVANLLCRLTSSKKTPCPGTKTLVSCAARYGRRSGLWSRSCSTTRRLGDTAVVSIIADLLPGRRLRLEDVPRKPVQRQMLPWSACDILVVRARCLAQAARSRFISSQGCNSRTGAPWCSRNAWCSGLAPIVGRAPPTVWIFAPSAGRRSMISSRASVEITCRRRSCGIAAGRGDPVRARSSRRKWTSSRAPRPRAVGRAS